MANVFFVDPYYQFRGKNSRLNVGGFITIYDRNTSDFSEVYEADGVTPKINPFTIDNNGRAAFKLDEQKTYRMEVTDSDGKLLWTCGLDQNGIVDVQTFYDTVEELSGQLPSFEWTSAGEVSGIGTISGGVSAIFGGDSLRTVFHDDTLSGNGTSASPLGVSPLTELAVDETMTAYETESSLVLGVNQEFLKDELDKKQDVIEFGYNEDKIISINSSALSAGATYEAGENIDITDEVISVTGKKALQTDETISVTRNPDSVVLGVNQEIVALKSDLPDLSDYATTDYVDTKTDRLGERIDNVEDELETKADKSELEGLVTTEELTRELNTKQDNLSTEQLYNIDNAITTTAGLASEQWVNDQGFAKESDIPSLDNYYTKTETSGASEIADALDNKQNNLTFSYVEI